MSTLISRRAAASLVSAGALLLGVLAAAPQAGAQPVYVCQKVGGTFHVVTSKQKCKKGENKLSLGVSGAGAMGVVGATGPAGPAGAAGANGINGAVGATGPVGKEGAPSTAKGTVGANGVTGATGPAGPTGPTGPIGLTGSTGPTGVTGATGSVGSVTTVTNTAKIKFQNPGTEGTLTATCGTGELPMSGGFSVELVGVIPSNSLRTATGWEVHFENQSNVEKESTVTVYAYCLKTGK